MNRYLPVSFYSLLLAACYAGAPPRPVPVALPPLSDEAVMNVQTKQRTETQTRQLVKRTCPADVKTKDDPRCLVTTRNVIEPVTRTITTATLGPETITYAQFQVLTDPGYHGKVARLDELRNRCQRADVPRWIGMTLMLGGLVTGAIGGLAEDPIIASVGGGAFAGGIGSYWIGYHRFNGVDCGRAHVLYRVVDLRNALGRREVVGAAQATEMKLLASQFNSRMGLQEVTNADVSGDSDDSDFRDNPATPPPGPPPGEAIPDEVPSPDTSVTPTPQ